MLHGRISRIAFAFSLVAQTSALVLVGYLGCGSPSPADGIPTCSPWFPPSLAPVLPRLLQSLVLPSIWFVPEFYPPEAFPHWTHEWAWVFSVAVTNVIAWTIVLTLGATAIRRAIRAAFFSERHFGDESGLPH